MVTRKVQHNGIMSILIIYYREFVIFAVICQHYDMVYSAIISSQQMINQSKSSHSDHTCRFPQIISPLSHDTSYINYKR